jgi:serine/threonine-protein kinase ATR
LTRQLAEDFLTLYRACFTELNNDDRCKAIVSLGRIPCAASGSLTVTRNENDTIRDSKCSLCEGTQPPDSALDTERCQATSNEAILTFSNLVKSSSFLDSRRPRVLAMIALKSFTVHFENREFVDLEVSNLGQWCLQSLRSSIRELRVAAG